MNARLRWVLATVTVMASGEYLVFVDYPRHPRSESRTEDPLPAAAAKIRDVERLLAEFAETGQPWCLERAPDLVEHLYPPAPELDSREQRRRRRAQLDLLFRIFVLVDSARDPLWDPRCSPAIRVRRPDDDDPAEVRDFEKKLADLEKGDRWLEAQIKLSRVEDDCIRAVASLVEAQYSATADDQAELTEAIQRILPEHARARRFLTMVPR